MNRIFSWFHEKKNPNINQDFIESLIVHKQINDFSSYLRQKEYRMLCIDGYFHLLPTIPDERYMSNLYELITKKSRLTSKELSNIIVNKLSRTILNNDFDLCEKILDLPLSSINISLPTYELIQLLHSCSNMNQKLKCLSILIEKNLPYDSEYLSWVLIILIEHYQIGDEIIIEHILNINKHINLLFTCSGNNNVTPLMLFFHLYSNNKCQLLIDYYLSNINDQSIFLQCDTWNRSYLTHLLCGQCQHEYQENSREILPDDITDMNKELMNKCPHAEVILSRFSMLHKLGNKCWTPIKTILTSRYCFPLRLLLFNYLYENNPSFELKLGEFFLNFPPQLISSYSNYLKRLVQNQNLNSTLYVLIQPRTDNDYTIENTIEFLLKQGARVDNMELLQSNIISLLAHGRSKIPFMLLDYSMYVDIPFSTWTTFHHTKMTFYICRVIQCGYPSEFRARFEEFKTHLSQQTLKSVNELIDLKNPQSLSDVCFQKLRGSLKHLGDDTLDKLKEHLPEHLRQSITRFGHEKSSTFLRTLTLNA